MSDNDRMDRAKRIRQMREGQRDDDSDETDGEADAGETDTGDRDADGTDADGRDAGGADTDGDDAPDTPADTAAAEAVENMAGTTASVPSTEEMEAAMERTMEQAEAVAPDETTDQTTAGSGAAGTAGATPDSSAPGTTEEAAGPTGIAAESATREAETRVLEFTLAGEQYCLDIEYIEEIVKQETITRVPNTPAFVEGVVDLRGQITTILNPKVAIGKDDRSAGDLIVVFDAEAFEDQGAIGWVVDDVRQVSPVSEDQVNDPPMGEDYINGVIDREDDDEFVIWTTPALALEEAE